MEVFNLTRVNACDVHELKRIEIECDLSPWTIASYESECERRDSVIIKAQRQDGEIVGFILGRVPSEGGEAEIYGLGVAPRFQRHGIGSRLLETFCNFCTERGSPALWLEVRASNQAAIDFYKSLGFREIGVRTGFYSNPRENAMLMTLILV